MNAPAAAGAAERLNHCEIASSCPPERVAAALAQEGPLDPAWLAERPHLFSRHAFYVDQADLDAMAALITCIESIVASPAYRQKVLATAPESAQWPRANPGVFLGYDFHLSADGPRLIEINTNAGGALLNTRLAQAWQPDPGVGLNSDASGLGLHLAAEPRAVEAAFLAMFRAEWQARRGAAPLRRLAIVDTEPEAQYLAPEFELFRRLFASAGWETLILDPAALEWDGRVLHAAGQPIDLVYNRLTDFPLGEPASAALRAAEAADAVVLTPHPQAHALYADKRNLVALSDPAVLAELGVAASAQALLRRGLPRTISVQPEAAEALWAERKRWFFKPADGFGSRATYRGDKLTKRVFAEILAGPAYVAQEVVPPSERSLRLDSGESVRLKVDIRNYAYRDQVQLVAARLYQGQTTNFRTVGGGFAPVVAVPPGFIPQLDEDQET